MDRVCVCCFCSLFPVLFIRMFKVMRDFLIIFTFHKCNACSILLHIHTRMCKWSYYFVQCLITIKWHSSQSLATVKMKRQSIYNCMRVCSAHFRNCTLPISCVCEMSKWKMLVLLRTCLLSILLVSKSLATARLRNYHHSVTKHTHTHTYGVGEWCRWFDSEEAPILAMHHMLRKWYLSDTLRLCYINP